LDASPDLLNVLNGTIDLRSGKLREIAGKTS
jgi:phage/plasmid-associated DNA primase